MTAAPTIASRARTAPLPSSGRLPAAKLENAVSDSLCGSVAALRAVVGVPGLRGEGAGCPRAGVGQVEDEKPGGALRFLYMVVWLFSVVRDEGEQPTTGAYLRQALVTFKILRPLLASPPYPPR